MVFKVNVASQAIPHGVLRVATSLNRSQLSRLANSGGAIRLARGLYIVDATLPPEQVARHHLSAIVAQTWPGGVLCGISAFAGGIPKDGHLFIAHPNPPRRTKLILPGVVITPVVGPGYLPGDIQLSDGVILSGPARALVENIDLLGRPARFRAGTSAVEDRIDELARSAGAGRIRIILEQLDVIATFFDPIAVEAVRLRLAAILGTVSGELNPFSDRLRARLSGEPFDGHRIALLEQLVEVLDEHPPRPTPANPPASRWEWLAFFEAYFSNFIEGTEFGVDEARRIAVEGIIPETRPADAHDVTATYRLAVNTADRIRVPRSGDELMEILQARHRVLMAARGDKHPGVFKQVPNFVGSYQFVAPDLVSGTFKRGFEVINPLIDPLSRAIAIMVLVTECHPFDDGNGRVARLTANAELSAAGQVRIVIPTVYRNNYLAALSGLSNGAGRGESLIAVLGFAQRWSAKVDWTSYDGANSILLTANAYLDSGIAEASGQRLTFPTD